MIRRGLLLVPTLAALSGCGLSGDRDAPRPGLWETTVELVSMENMGLPPKDLDALRKAMSKPVVERECFDRPIAPVGESTLEGRCKVTRQADSGTAVDREWRCPASAEYRRRIITFGGTRGTEQYDLRVTARSSRPGGKDMIVVTRERGRRVGDCPAKS